MRSGSKHGRWLARVLVRVLVLAGWLAAPAVAAPVCSPDPLGGRALYLRGTFNSWNADETQKFTWACSRWELVTRLKGEHSFKVADESWSADADFGQGAVTDTEITLLRRGPEIKRRFDGVQRFTLSPNAGTPQLQVQACPAAAPLGQRCLGRRAARRDR